MQSRPWFFPVVVYGCESWTSRRLSAKEMIAFELWCLRVPWTARRLNQSILKEINPEYSLEGLMLKLKLQNFGIWCEEPTQWKRPWCWERSMARGKVSSREWDGWIVSLTQRTWVWANSRRQWRTGKPGVLHGVVKSWPRLRVWTLTQEHPHRKDVRSKVWWQGVELPRPIQAHNSL